MDEAKIIEISEHFDIEDVEGEGISIVANQEFARAMHGISAGLGAKKRKRCIIDYDPDYPYFVVREVPIR